MVKKHWKLVVLLIVAGLALCVGAVVTKQAAEREQEVTIEQVPQAVKATILAEAKGQAVEEIDMETEDGQIVYEADVIIDGKEVEIRVAADGTLISTKVEEDDDEGDDDEDEGDDDEDEDEAEVSLSEVPEAVKATILKEAGGAEIEEVVKETEDGREVYEAEFVANGQEVEIEVAADGSLLEREVEDDDDED